ncbi:MAG TPA: HAD family hydrolase [bacterium]|nr:HAD family hydrolase [bacterium]
MSQPYRVILFDCFNTLYLQDPSHLPQVELDGKRVTSTAGLLLERLRALDPGLQAEAVHHAHRAAWKWAEAQRGPELREVPAPRRFRRAFEELGLGDADEALVLEALDVHMRALTGSFQFPPEHRAVLEGLRGRYRLALLSNFDHGPALRRLLAETGIADWLDPLLISDGLGWRKPGRAAFTAALEQIGATAEAVLFVGDSLEDDVLGSQGAGLDVAWLNPHATPCPAECRPTYELRSLVELPALLGH